MLMAGFMTQLARYCLRNRIATIQTDPQTLLDNTTEARLNELESKLAFAEDLIETLNETIVRQQKLLDSLQDQLRLLHAQMKERPDAETRDLRDEIPPHY